MKKVFFTISLMAITVICMSQTTITTGMTGAQLRTALNNNFTGIYAITYNTTGSTTGVISKNGVRWLHNYPGRMSAIYDGSGQDSAVVGKNLFIGLASGNFTMNKLTGCNVAIGDSTGFSLTTGLVNTFIGFSAGKYNTSGQRNVFIGRQAGWKNTTGSSQTAVGESALQENTTGDPNTAVGTNSQMYNKGGSGNTSIGFNSLFGSSFSMTGINNTAVGDGSLAAITDGRDNTAIGISSGPLITTGDFNCIMGSSAMGTMVSGTYNVSLGTLSLYTNTEGDNNVAVGTGAGRNNAIGDANVFIGNAAGYYETGSNKLFIDNATRTNEADARIKALVYGTFAAAPVDQRFTLNAVLKLTPMASPPGSPEEGMIYADTDHHLYYYNGSTWVQLDN